MQLRRLVGGWVVCLALLGHPSSARAYTPPIGIPAPPLCGDPVAWPTPTLWVNWTTGNNGNPGTEGSPKKTIPIPLAAGTVVRLVGPYLEPHVSPDTLILSGTALAPVWIQQEVGSWDSYAEISGTYFYIDLNVSYAGAVIRAQPDSSDTHHFCVQDTEIDGQYGAGGFTVQTYEEGTTVSVHDGVFIRNHIHDLCDLDATGDPDCHCFSIYKPKVYNIWYLNNTLQRCAGDGIQVNATAGFGTTGRDAVHHIYFGGNVVSQMRQFCAWSKQSLDMVVASNTCDGAGYNRPSDSGPGGAWGCQYDCKRFWILNNTARDVENCVALSSTMSTPGDAWDAEEGVVVAGNLCYDIHWSSGVNDVDDAFSNGACIRIWAGGAGITVANNTCDDVEGGIQVSTSTATVYHANNILTDYVRNALLFENTANISGTSGYALYASAPTFNLNGSPVTQSDAERITAHSLWGDPLYVNIAIPNRDYRVTSPSPAVAAGNGLDLNTSMQALHGVNTGVNTANIGAKAVVSAGTTGGLGRFLGGRRE